MKSDQVFETIEIANKLGLIKLYKEISKKASKFEREKSRVYNKIRLEHIEDINRYKLELEKKGLPEEEVKKLQGQYFSEIVESHELSDTLYDINDEINALNFEFMEGFLSRIPQAKKEVYQFVSTFKEISIDEVKNDINIIIETFKEVISDPNLQSLFKSLKI